MFIKEVDSWCPECQAEVSHVVEHIKYRVPITYHPTKTEYEYSGEQPEEFTAMMPYVVDVAVDKHSTMVKVQCPSGHEWSAEIFINDDEKDRQKDLLAGVVDPTPEQIVPGVAGEAEADQLLLGTSAFDVYH